MKAWELEQIRRASQSKWAQRGTRPFNGHVCTDSRQAAEGDLFVAIVGKKFDAHDFLDQVVQAGVCAILLHRPPDAKIVAAAQARDVALLLTDDTVAALNRLAAAYRQEMRAKVITVSGSNGKTTTKRIIHAILAEKFHGHASPKSFNNNIGVPLTMLEVEPAHDYVVLEIGTNAPGEIAALAEVARPDIAVITNVGLEHLELLGDLDGVAREEAAIATFLQPGGTLILPSEAPELLHALRLAVEGGAQRVTVGRTGSHADLEATEIGETMAGVTFTINGRTTFRLGLLGEHNALNALLALAVARRMGLSEAQIQAGLDVVKAAPMRLEVATVAGRMVLNDAYNANPSSMAASLQTFARLSVPSGTRRVAVLADMLELGAATNQMHRQIGELITAWKIPVFVAIGPAMTHAAAAARSTGNVSVYHFENTAAAGRQIAAILEPSDAVLLKGSRGMALEKIVEVLAGPKPVPVTS